jgi:SWI/SNF-related matrix-associated actin-dependent regulator 1 of chromatin subfamily A
LINLDDIRGGAAIRILAEYKGINPYLKKLRNEYLKNNKIRLTDTQEKYIIDNHDKEPLLVNRVVKITQYLGDELQKQHELKFIPERILIEYILGENEKSFHVYGKLKRNQVDSGMYWLPKTQVLDDPYFEEINIDVDFTRYNDVLGKQKKKLYQHQEQGIKFLLARNGCILADDMGLGKSIQSIIAAEESKAKNILVICPASVKINWQREINLFCDETVIVDGTGWNKSKYTIINYDILKKYHTIEDKTVKEEKIPIIRDMVNAKFDLVIIDEAHCVKDSKANRSKIVNDLVINFGIPKVWLLTGTPVANRPIDFYNLLKLIKSPIANNWDYFTKRYCGAKTIFTTLKNGKKKQVRLNNGATNLEELAQKTKNILLRRLKSEVLDMPKKVVIPVYHELSDKAKKEYDQLWDNYLIERKKKKKRGAIDRDLVEVILLRKFIAMQTIPETIELVNNALEMDKKVIVFTNFTDELMELHEHFAKISVVHYGGMSNSAKQDSVDTFQNNDKIRLFIGNEISAGVGITLTKATVVIFNSFAWVPGLNEQAEDRCYRLGQNEDVNIYYQMFINTISTRMFDTLKEKQEIISTIVGDKKLTEEELTEIMIDNLMDEL